LRKRRRALLPADGDEFLLFSSSIVSVAALKEKKEY